MSLQTELNAIVKHLRKQGQPAFQNTASGWNNGACCYRTDDGLACAVGCRISDKQIKSYRIGGEGGTTGVGNLSPYLLGELAKKARVPVEELVAFYQDMQTAHDEPALDRLTGKQWLEEFENLARAVAKEHGLKYPPKK